MKKEFVESEIEKMIKLGSSKEELEKTKKLLEQSNFYQDRSLEEIIMYFRNKLEIDTKEVLDARKYDMRYVCGISSMIFLPDYNNKNSIKVKILGGNISRNMDSLDVDENTLFDVASITKVFSLILVLKLAELGYIDLNKPVALDNPNFKGLEDFTYNDLIRLHGKLYTNGHPGKASNKQEAMEMLKTVHLISKDRTDNLYTDLGAIAISKTIEKIMSEKLGRYLSYDQIMKMFILDPYGMKNACFNPKTKNVTGNGNNLGLVHDPKSRMLGGNVGSAGLFINSEDLSKLAYEMFKVNYVNYDKLSNIISKNNLKRLGEITFPNGNQPHKGNFGIYVKHKDGLDLTWIPNDYSDGSFAHQGWTGPVAMFDPNNLIHNNVLVNSIAPEIDQEYKKNDKLAGHRDLISDYLDKMAKLSVEMLLTKRYFDKYEMESQIIDETVSLNDTKGSLSNSVGRQ